MCSSLRVPLVAAEHGSGHHDSATEAGDKSVWLCQSLHGRIRSEKNWSRDFNQALPNHGYAFSIYAFLVCTGLLLQQWRNYSLWSHLRELVNRHSGVVTSQLAEHGQEHHGLHAVHKSGDLRVLQLVGFWYGGHPCFLVSLPEKEPNLVTEASRRLLCVLVKTQEGCFVFWLKQWWVSTHRSLRHL